MKHTEGVPRGLLRLIVLKFLAEKSMSGVEIVERISQETKQKWKPSPGSIYPLLSWLHHNKFTFESSKNENGKQYSLTSKGKEFFKEQVVLGENFLEKMRCLMPMFIAGFQFNTCETNSNPTNESAIRLLQTFIELNSRKYNLTNEHLADIAKILDESNTKLNNIIQRIDGSGKQHFE